MENHSGQPPQAPEGEPSSSPSRPPTTGREAGQSHDAAAMRDIGKGFRWYDLPYVLLRSLHRWELALRLPARLRLKLREASNFLYQTHYMHERRRSRERYRFDNVELPTGEEVAMPGAWVVEYFTASGIGKLYEAIRGSGWDGAGYLGTSPGGTQSLTSSRRGQGQTWWRIAELTSGPGGYSTLETQRAKLPPGVQGIHLIGVAIGNGLTAVVAGFSLNESVSERLNEQLHASHRFEVIRRKGQMAVAQPPKAVLHYWLQSARNDVHRELRRWMSRTLPGTFARLHQPHPLFDVIFFKVADPLANEGDTSRDDNDALRGMGLDRSSWHAITSDELPGLVLEEPVDRHWAPEISENVWSLWGNRDAVEELTKGTGNSGVSAAGYYVGAHMTDYMARSGLSALLQLLRSDSSAAHDNARQLHGGTSSRDLQRLRNRMLTTSLDLATLEEDIRTYNGRRWRDREPQFYFDYAPRFKERHAQDGRKPLKPVDMNKRERKLQKNLARELVAFDAEYREVMSTVASLGASLDSRRVQRVAIWISLVSAGVAVATLWATQEPPPDLLAFGCATLRGLGWQLC